MAETTKDNDWPEGTAFTFEPGDGSFEVTLPPGHTDIPPSLQSDPAAAVLTSDGRTLKNYGERG